MKDRIIKILIIVVSIFFKPKKNRIILNFNNEDIMFNTKYLFGELIKENYDTKYIINDSLRRKELEKEYNGKYFISNKTFEDKVYILNSKIWITDGNFPIVTPFSHKNRILINLWHGIPLKKVGLKGYTGLKKIKVMLMLKCFAKYYSCFSVTSNDLKKIINESFLVSNEKIKVMGQVRNDSLYKAHDRNQLLHSIYGNIKDLKKVILYAPTWREGPYGSSWNYGDTVFFPFEDFEEIELNKFLEEKKILLILRPHHLQKIKLKETEWIKVLDSNKIKDIMEILNIFDGIITDYSSIYFDFLLLNRPIIFIPYDLEIYEREVGFNFDYNLVTPGSKVLNQKDFLYELSQVLDNPQRDQDKRKKINDRFNEVKIGASELMMKFIKESQSK